MDYKVSILPSALRQLKRIPKPIRAKIRTKIDSLAVNPRPTQSKPLKGKQNYIRFRVRDYRVIYRIKDDQLLVLVVKVGHRKDVYRSL